MREIEKISLYDDRDARAGDPPLADDEMAIRVDYADGGALCVPRDALNWAEWRARMDEHRP